MTEEPQTDDNSLPPSLRTNIVNLFYQRKLNAALVSASSTTQPISTLSSQAMAAPGCLQKFDTPISHLLT